MWNRLHVPLLQLIKSERIIEIGPYLQKLSQKVASFYLGHGVYVQQQ